jgi:hypothetical protein
MRFGAVLTVLLLGVTILASAGIATADTTPSMACAETLDGGSVVVTLVAISTSTIRPEDMQIILVPPDHSAWLVEFPRNNTECNSSLGIDASLQTGASSDGYLQAGDSLRISDSEHPLAVGEWQMFLIYKPSGYPTTCLAWNITMNEQGHQQFVIPQDAQIPTDPMVFYGFLLTHTNPDSDAGLVLLFLVATTGVIGAAAWRRIAKDRP